MLYDNDFQIKEAKLKAAVKYSWAVRQFASVDNEHAKSAETSKNRLRRCEAVYRKLHGLTNEADSFDLWHHYRTNYCKSMEV